GKPFIPPRGVRVTQRSGDLRCGARSYSQATHRRLPGRGHASGPRPTVTGPRLAECTLIRGLVRGDGRATPEHAIRTRELPHGHAHDAGPRAMACTAPIDPLHHGGHPGHPDYR